MRRRWLRLPLPGEKGGRATRGNNGHELVRDVFPAVAVLVDADEHLGA
jgi:hypothetical protein